MEFKAIVEEGDDGGVTAVRALVEIEPDSGEDDAKTKNNDSDSINLGYNFEFDKKDNKKLRRKPSLIPQKELYVDVTGSDSQTAICLWNLFVNILHCCHST